MKDPREHELADSETCQLIAEEQLNEDFSSSAEWEMVYAARSQVWATLAVAAAIREKA